MINENEIHFVNDGDFVSKQKFDRRYLVSVERFRQITKWGVASFVINKTKLVIVGGKIDIKDFLEKEINKEPFPRPFLNLVIKEIRRLGGKINFKID